MKTYVVRLDIFDKPEILLNTLDQANALLEGS